MDKISSPGGGVPPGIWQKPGCQDIPRVLFGPGPSRNPKFGLVSPREGQDYFMHAFPQQLHKDVGVDLSRSKLKILDATTISRLNAKGFLTPLMTIEGLLEGQRQALTARGFVSSAVRQMRGSALTLTSTLQSSFLMMARDLAVIEPRDMENVFRNDLLPPAQSRIVSYVGQAEDLATVLRSSFSNRKMTNFGNVLSWQMDNLKKTLSNHYKISQLSSDSPF